LQKVEVIKCTVTVIRELFTLSLHEAAELFDLETKSTTGRPLGDAGFMASVEKKLGYSVRPQKRGPKPQE
jgi:hypothetical protein